MWWHYIEQLGIRSAQYEMIGTARYGASGPKVVFIQNNNSGECYAVKYGEEKQLRVPLSVQVRNRKIITELFGEDHVPGVIKSGERIIIMPALKGEILHQAVVEGAYDLDYILKIFGMIIEQFSAVWKNTARPFEEKEFTRDPIQRAERIKRYIEASVFDSVCLEEAKNAIVSVNEIEYGSLDSILQKMVMLYEPPKKIVLCHGDPNADNVVINGCDKWWLIDWEWVGSHDWRVLVSHLIGWWRSNAFYIQSLPSIKVTKDHIRIRYSLISHPFVQYITEFAWRLAEEMGVFFLEDNWKKQVLLQLGILLLGDLRFIEARKKTHHSLPLLGEGLKILAQV